LADAAGEDLVGPALHAAQQLRNMIAAAFPAKRF